MRLSPVLHYMPRVAARLFSLAVEAKTKISLASAQGSVDRRKSPGRHARIGAAIR
jgi:hypothetical protein